MSECLRSERRGSVLLLELHRPKVLNALDASLMAALGEAFDAAEADDAVGAVILTGGPTERKPSFAAGADINELAALGAMGAAEHARKGQTLLRRIERLRKPVIAAVNGFALGGGCELAMACHIRIASREAVFGQPEIDLGIMPGYAGTQRLARFVGRGRALELLLGGEKITAEEAFRIGLVNRVTEPQDLLPAAEALASKLAAKAPLARRFILAAVDRGLDMSFDQAEALEADLFGLVRGTADAAEGLSAFLEKRPPRFSGR